MKTFKQRLMLVATLMVIAVSGYAQEEFKTIFTTNFDDGNIGKWNSWGNSSTRDFFDSDRDGGGKCLKLYNPSGTAFDQAQLGYDLDDFLFPAKTYKISFYAKFEGEDENCQLQFQYQNKPSWGSQKRFDPVTITKQWAPYEIKFSTDYTDVNQILINFGQNQGTFYIDDIVFGYYEEGKDDPGSTPETKPVTPTGSLNNTMYYDGTQWCLMLEDFEGEDAVARVKVEKEDGSATATVVDDPHNKSKKSLNFYGPFGHKTYCYIDVTLPDSKTLSSFTNLIFDVVYNPEGTNNQYKNYKVNIGNTSTKLDTSTNLGIFSSGSPVNTEEWIQKSFSLGDNYKDSNTFRIFIGTEWSSNSNLFIDNIRLSVPTPTASGTCGSPTETDVNWMLDENSKTLYISGKGDIADYNVEPNNIPWNANKDNISKIIIGEGITAIGKQNFCDHNGLESVVLPSTLKQIGEKGLYARNENKKIEFTFHSNPTMADKALHENSDSYTATLVLDDALSPFFAAKSDNTFNGGIQYKRTLSAEKSTITLPFTPKSGLENCKFYKLSSASEDNLTFEEVSKTNLEPNKPYIMVKTEPTEIDFSTDVSTIIPANAKASEPTSGPWTMHGTYSTLVKNREDNAYGFTGNYLKKNTGNMTVKPFRAYFTTSINKAKDYLDVIFGGEVTGIERNEFSPEGITEIFSLDGKKQDCLQKGMNIVKMNNGSIKKIVIK